MQMNRVLFGLIACLLCPWLLAAAQAAESPAELQARVNDAVNAMNNLDYDQAVKILETALAEAGNYAGPEAVEAHKQLGLAYLAVRKQDQAADQFRQALTLDRRALLDPDVASPAAIELFEGVRKSLGALPPAPPATAGIAAAPPPAVATNAGDAGLTFGKWFTLSLGAVAVGGGVFCTASAAATAKAAVHQQNIGHPNTSRRLKAWVTRFDDYSIAGYASGVALWGVSGALFGIDAKRAARRAESASALVPTLTLSADGAAVAWRFR